MRLQNRLMTFDSFHNNMDLLAVYKIRGKKYISHQLILYIKHPKKKFKMSEKIIKDSSAKATKGNI